MMTGRPVYRRYQDLDLPKDAVRKREALRAIAVAPILYEGKVIGCMNVASHIFDEIPPFSRHAIETIASQIGGVIIRLKTEESLRVSEQRYALAVTGGKVGIWDWNLRTGEMVVAPELKEFLGYEDHEIADHIEDWVSHIHPADKLKVMEAAQAHIDGKTSEYRLEHRMLHKDGSIRWFLASGTAERDAAGKAIRFIGTDTDITELKTAEKALQNARDELERKVEERTSELAKAYEELETKAANLEEANIALKVLLQRVASDKKEFEKRILLNVKELVIPCLEKMKKCGLSGRQKAYADILESNLHNIISPFLETLSARYSDLTPKEIQVANLVKEGKTTKEISELMTSGTDVIDFHRKNIRRKLGLRNTKTNLRSYLLSRFQ